jgi:hypothetical protein
MKGWGLSTLLWLAATRRRSFLGALQPCCGGSQGAGFSWLSLVFASVVSPGRGGPGGQARLPRHVFASVGSHDAIGATTPLGSLSSTIR